MSFSNHSSIRCLLVSSVFRTHRSLCFFHRQSLLPYPCHRNAHRQYCCAGIDGSVPPGRRKPARSRDLRMCQWRKLNHQGPPRSASGNGRHRSCMMPHFAGAQADFQGQHASSNLPAEITATNPPVSSANAVCRGRPWPCAQRHIESGQSDRYYDQRIPRSKYSGGNAANPAEFGFFRNLCSSTPRPIGCWRGGTE